jgi:hypothetical protein
MMAPRVISLHCYSSCLARAAMTTYVGSNPAIRKGDRNHVTDQRWTVG